MYNRAKIMKKIVLKSLSTEVVSRFSKRDDYGYCTHCTVFTACRPEKHHASQISFILKSPNIQVLM